MSCSCYLCFGFSGLFIFDCPFRYSITFILKVNEQCIHTYSYQFNVKANGTSV